MRGHGEKSTRKQEVGIANLLTAPTIADAADAASICEPLLWRCLQRDDFQTAYRQAKRGAVSQAVAFLWRAAGEAVAIRALSSGIWRHGFKYTNNGSQTKRRHNP
jgi:hypothetical protein